MITRKEYDKLIEKLIKEYNYNLKESFIPYVDNYENRASYIEDEFYRLYVDYSDGKILIGTKILSHINLEFAEMKYTKISENEILLFLSDLKMTINNVFEILENNIDSLVKE